MTESKYMYMKNQNGTRMISTDHDKPFGMADAFTIPQFVSYD